MVPQRLEHRAEPQPGKPMLDNLGIVYIVLNIFWTTVVLAGSAALWYFRHQECIRKRNAGLTVTAVLCLQIYWSLNMIMYPLNGAYPCDLNFWIMSIYFPLGTALFQLQNVQLLSVSARQRDLRRQPFRRSDRLTSRHFQFWKYGSSWNQMTLLSKIYFGISICIITQIILSFTVFFVSRKFVSFGVTGDEGPRSTCTKGWQWVITILYQAIWTYLFGPWLLWRIRKIHDIFHWKLQTVLAIVFSLPGLPMWLIATNVDGWAPVVAKFPNGCWYNPGICVMQAVAICFPLYEVLRAKHYRLRTWPESEKTLQPSFSADVESQIKGSKHSLKAFEEALQNASDDLLEYASTREFTGENIIFLNSVRDFKASWQAAAAAAGKDENEQPSAELRREYFALATEIFDRSVSLHTAAFPINIESHVYTTLIELFERDELIPPNSSVITPFADRWSLATIAALTRTSEKYTTNTTTINTNNRKRTHTQQRHRPGTNPQTTLTGPSSSESILSTSTSNRAANTVPDAFDISVFDPAERSIKYMVFTNTWGRYVESWRESSVTGSTLSTAEGGGGGGGGVVGGTRWSNKPGVGV